jgi:hypothetical protein
MPSQDGATKHRAFYHLPRKETYKCMKSAKTMNCKMCMIERKEILHRMKTNKHKLINDNSDIFARCSYECRFHKFFCTDSTTLRMRLTQKKSPLRDIPNSQEYDRYSPFQILTTSQPAALNYAPLVTQRCQLRRLLRVPGFFIRQCAWTSSKKPYCYPNAQP